MKQNFIYFLALSFFIPPCVLGEENQVLRTYSLDEAHSIFAKRTNSETWKLMQKESLSEEEKDLLVYSAFSSAYHWKKIGAPVHIQRAEWLISRVYAKLNIGASALFHAKKCLAITNRYADGLKDFDYAYAYEAMARAYALVNDRINASQFYEKAKQVSESIAKPEDKKLFLSDLNSGNWNGYLPGKFTLNNNN